MGNGEAGAGGRSFQAFFSHCKVKMVQPPFFSALQITFKGSCCHLFTSIVSKLLSLWTQDADFSLTVPKQ